MKKTALLTGISGQAGSYLAELLLERGYEVHGIIRRSSSFNTGRIDHIFDKIKMHYGNLSDGLNIYHLINEIRPTHVFNVAAQSHVRTSFDIPVESVDITATGTMRILESIRQIEPTIKFLQFSTSEMFGKVHEIPQKETTPFHPRSPYACAKVFSYWITRNYREAYNMFACNAIIFNMESPRRGGTFVTKKITDYVREGNWEKPLQLGNLNALRDWGYCRDYMDGVIKIIEHEYPDDFVLSTGETHTVRKFAELAFKEVGIDIIWKGDGLEEKGIDKKTKKALMEINKRFFRPAEVALLKGDSSKARKELGWKPKLSFEELIELMVEGE
jgi:GDPmannose 4,6-dehydratase